MVKRRGRPTTQGREGEKSTLGIRASGALKGALIVAAQRNGRSLSQEAELRLEQSFRNDSLARRLRQIIREEIDRGKLGG